MQFHAVIPFYDFSTFPLWLQSFRFPPTLPSPIHLIFPKFPILATELVLQLKHNVSPLNYFMTSFTFQDKHIEDISPIHEF